MFAAVESIYASCLCLKVKLFTETIKLGGRWCTAPTRLTLIKFNAALHLQSKCPMSAIVCHIRVQHRLLCNTLMKEPTQNYCPGAQRGHMRRQLDNEFSSFKLFCIRNTPRAIVLNARCSSNRMSKYVRGRGQIECERRARRQIVLRRFAFRVSSSS